MKIRLPAVELKQALTGLLKIIPRKSTLSVLQGVRIEVAEDTVRLTATDLDSTVYYTCENATVIEPGIVVIAGARRLKELVTQAKKDVAEIAAVDDQTVRLSLHGELGEREHVLPAADFVDWPADPTPLATQTLEAAFIELYRSLVPFGSTDASRAILNGVCIDVTKGKHTLVATDGRRLAAFNSIKLPVKETCVIPTNKFLATVKADGPGWIGVSKDNTRFQIDTGPWSVCCKTIEGMYPAWRQVVPNSDGANGFNLDETDLAVLEDAVRTLPVGDEEHKAVCLMPFGNSTRLGAQDRETGTWSYRLLSASTFFGEATTVNREFLRDAVKVGFRNFRWNDANSPLVSTTDTGTHVLMPVRADKPSTVSPPKDKPTPTETPKPQKEKPVIKPKDQAETEGDAGCVEQLWLSYQTVRDRVRDLNTALSELGDQLRETKKQDKTVRAELKNARGVLAKLQNISI